MIENIKLGLTAIIPIGICLLVYILDKKIILKKYKFVKQIIFGIIFGLLAILSTEYGVRISGTVTNVRDACVLIAGLIFGAPAGIIAGLIGGVERWFAFLWGAGEYTRLACSVSTVLAGIVGEVLRKWMFDNKRPPVLYALGIGCVMEVFHMLMIFLTNMYDIEKAFIYVQKCSAPMILINGLAVMLSVFLINILEYKKLSIKKQNAYIILQFQKGLSACIFLATVIIILFTFTLQNSIFNSDTDNLLKLNLEDVKNDIQDASNRGTKESDKINILVSTENRHIGKNGSILIVDSNFRVYSDRYGSEGKQLDKSLIKDDVVENTRFNAKIYDDESYCMYSKCNGYYIIAVIPRSEAEFSRNISIYITIFMEVVVFAVLFIFVFFLVKTRIVNNIKKVNNSLSLITNGNLNETVNVRTNEEFSSLSDDINKTVDTLKLYIKEAEARIDKELEFAKTIQHSALPSVFPPFPNRNDIDIFAQMDAAKEVGGDFYDFYFTSENELVFLIADVSGKGIPAAMFMMRAKTLIKSYAEAGMSLEQVLSLANDNLCEGNEAEMFVTAWLGRINLLTGELSFANAGHNPPVICHEDGECEFIKVKPGFVLGGMEGIKYKINNINLLKGDILFLYTDGVTEAANTDLELYGEDRLCNIISKMYFTNAEKLCKDIKKDIDDFVGEAPQFDDITMLCIKQLEVDKCKK